VARRNGVRVVEITLWLFGGVAKLEGDADDPGAEFRIAAAGPAMSAVSAVVAGVAAWGVDRADGSTVLVSLLVWLAAINVVLAVSNLLPAFPLDGGRMLRAMLWRRSRRKLPATRRASLIGQVLAAVLVLGGVALMVWFELWTGIWTAALGVFLLVAARSEWSASAARPELLRQPARDYGRRLPQPLGPRSTVAELERVLAAHPDALLVPVVDDAGHVSGLVARDALARIPPAQRPVVPARSLAEPVWSLPRVDPAEPVADVLTRLGEGRSWWALLVNGNGVEGVLCSDDVEVVVEHAT
jgi:Zn-dependent protease